MEKDLTLRALTMTLCPHWGFFFGFVHVSIIPEQLPSLTIMLRFMFLQNPLSDRRNSPYTKSIIERKGSSSGWF